MEMPDGSVYIDKLITLGSSPGYRNIMLRVALEDGTPEPRVVDLHFAVDDALNIMLEILAINRLAWERGPVDARDNEKQPHWLYSL